MLLFTLGCRGLISGIFAFPPIGVLCDNLINFWHKLVERQPYFCRPFLLMAQETEI